MPSGASVPSGASATTRAQATPSEFWSAEYGSDGVCTLKFSNPPTHLMPMAGMAELARKLDRIADDDEVCVLVIAGAQDGVFVAGADPEERVKVGRGIDVGIDPAVWYHATFSLQSFPAPTLAAVSGPAVGGGTEIALAADIRFAAASATFGLAEVLQGIIPAAGGSQRLPRLIGKARAAQMIYEGRVIAAADALEIGLVQAVFDDSVLESAVAEYAGRLARSPAAALRAAKMAVMHGSDVPIQEGTALERRLYLQLQRSDEVIAAQEAALGQGGDGGASARQTEPDIP